MPVLTTNPTLLRDQLVPDKNPSSSSIKIAQSMGRRHICPCCSSPLLRHVYLGQLYWRCNRCYQAMPVMEEAQVMPLVETHEEVFWPLLFFSNPLQKE